MKKHHPDRGKPTNQNPSRSQNRSKSKSGRRFNSKNSEAEDPFVGDKMWHHNAHVGRTNERDWTLVLTPDRDKLLKL